MDLRIRTKFSLLLALTLGSVIFFLRPASAYDYQVTDLGNLGGSPTGVSAKAYGINDSVQVVGQSNYNYNYNSYGFIWQNGSITNLGEMSSGGHTYARDINGAGQVVGSSPYSTGGGGYGGFLWQNGSMTHLVGQGFWTEANAINNKSQAVGNSMAYNRLDSYGHLWDGGTRTDLGSLGGHFTFAEGVNDQTQVVGWSMASDGNYYAFIWQNGAMVPISTDIGSKAYDINNSGKAVGVSNSGAFLWVNGLTQSIGGPGSGAYAINEKGEIVGWSDGNAVVWKDGQMIDLNTLIPSDSGWVLAEATGINNNGYIIGNGFVTGDDQLHAFMISPVPEPSSLLLLMSGLFGLLGIKRLR